MWQAKNVVLWAHKFTMRSLLLAGMLLAFLALAPTVNAEITISINPPVCSYGYYNYSPYACAPSGYYGPGYFYNGIFLGMGPWANWGYSHGWGGHRFSGGGGGRYVGTRGNGGARRPSAARASRSGPHGGVSAGRTHAAPVRSGSSHGASHAAAARGSVSHGGGERASR